MGHIAATRSTLYPPPAHGCDGAGYGDAVDRRVVKASLHRSHSASRSRRRLDAFCHRHPAARSRMDWEPVTQSKRSSLPVAAAWKDTPGYRCMAARRNADQRANDVGQPAVNTEPVSQARPATYFRHPVGRLWPVRSLSSRLRRRGE
jgi:hypothetical protein